MRVGLRRLALRAERLAFRFRSRGRHAVDCQEHVDGLTLDVPAEVLNPVLFRTGPLLGRTVVRRLPAAARVLDMGAGSGVVGLLAARAGAEVVAVDVSTPAVEAVRRNARRSGLVVDARLGDLWAPIREDERFDLVAFNPPFFSGRPPEGLGPGLLAALYDAPGLPILERFLAGARPHLAPGAELLIAASTHGALGTMREAYARHGFRWDELVRVERISEALVIDRLS